MGFGRRARSEEDVLIRSAVQGDRNAFDRLRQGHETDLRRFIGSRAQATEVDDLVQDTWLAAWRALPRFRFNARFQTWLFAIAVHKCSGHYRSRRDVEVPLADLVVVSPESTRGMASVEDRAMVQDLLKELEPSQSEVLEMYYLLEMSLPDIARVLERNLNTVKYQFYRAHVVAAEKWKEASKRGGMA